MAEAVLRTATVPVYIVGPEVVDGNYRNFATKTILCALSLLDTSYVVARFAAELATQHNARLILQHVIRPQERAEVLAGRTIDDIEADLLALVPDELREKITVQAIVVPGDPTEELLYQARAQQADLIVLGAQGASAFAAITRHGRGLQGAGPLALPGHHAFAGGAGGVRSDVRQGASAEVFWRECFRPHRNHRHTNRKRGRVDSVQRDPPVPARCVWMLSSNKVLQSSRYVTFLPLAGLGRCGVLVTARVVRAHN